MQSTFILAMVAMMTIVNHCTSAFPLTPSTSAAGDNGSLVASEEAFVTLPTWGSRSCDNGGRGEKVVEPNQTAAGSSHFDPLISSSSVVRLEYTRSFAWWEFLWKNERPVTFCSGSLISTREVLTAAHCIIHRFKCDHNARPPTTPGVVIHAVLRWRPPHSHRLSSLPLPPPLLGGNNVENEEEQEVRLQVASCHLHPNFTLTGGDRHDIAILRLNESITTTTTRAMTTTPGSYDSDDDDGYTNFSSHHQQILANVLKLAAFVVSDASEGINYPITSLHRILRGRVMDYAGWGRMMKKRRATNNSTEVYVHTMLPLAPPSERMLKHGRLQVVSGEEDPSLFLACFHDAIAPPISEICTERCSESVKLGLFPLPGDSGAPMVVDSTSSHWKCTATNVLEAAAAACANASWARSAWRFVHTKHLDKRNQTHWYGGSLYLYTQFNLS